MVSLPAEGGAITAVSHRLVGDHVDGFLEEVHRPVTEGEKGPARVLRLKALRAGPLAAVLITARARARLALAGVEVDGDARARIDRVDVAPALANMPGTLRPHLAKEDRFGLPVGDLLEFRTSPSVADDAGYPTAVFRVSPQLETVPEIVVVGRAAAGIVVLTAHTGGIVGAGPGLIG